MVPVCGFATPGAIHGGITFGSPLSPPASEDFALQQAPACEDFAQRQVQLADRILQQSNYARSLKVLNSTAKNCDIELVREKIVEVLEEWYGTVRAQNSNSAIRQFRNVLANQSYISSAQKSRFERRMSSQVQTMIRREYDAENFRAAQRLCRSYPDYSSDNFESQYYCGASALETGASESAMESFQWLVQNWKEDQSLTNWSELTGRLEKLYFLNGQFRAAYELARKQSRRDPSPKAVLSSLISVRGQFLSPVLRTGVNFYDGTPAQASLSVVRTEMQRVNFPKYVKAIYLLASDGSVEDGIYGSEANQPGPSLLETASGTVSLLQSAEESSLAWLVSPVGNRFFVLEFGVATTPDENARLETVLNNIGDDQQWEKLYDLEFKKTAPATGSAVATFLSGFSLRNEDWGSYDALFDDSSLLTYYCIQDQSGTATESFNFGRANLGYGDSEWKRTSNTPALYHHSVEYGGESIREVVWPRFVDENWTGVVRVGLNHG